MSIPKPSKVPAEQLRSARVEAALERAITAGDTVELFEQLRRNSGLPGPRANWEFARAAGLAIAAYGVRADPLVRAFSSSPDEFQKILAAIALAARSVAGIDGAAALATLQILGEDPHHLVRGGVAEALRVRIRALGQPAIDELAGWTDGYLQASVALAALADRDLLAQLPTSAGPSVLARLDEAFHLADASPRAAERSQGVRTLRQELPAQIVVFAGRWSETIDWLEQAALAKRPETREVMEKVLSAVRKSVISDAAAKRLFDAFDANAPVRRDADRVVQGTRNRSKGRR